jgi:hypothetical protein
LLAPAAGASSASPPRIEISTPKDGAVVHTPSVTVKGTFTVAPFPGPSPTVSATLNGKKLKTGVNSRVSYTFEGTATLHRGANELTVVVNDGDGGESKAAVSVRYAPIRPPSPTRHQCVGDRRGDSHDHLNHMDIVRACALRRGGKVIFSVTTAKPPPNVHDSFGHPAAPCIEIPLAAPGAPGPYPIQSCGDAQLRGWHMHVWPKVPFSIVGRVTKWKVPIKYLPKGSFLWRAYLSEADHYRDKAPNKGFLTFVL